MKKKKIMLLALGLMGVLPLKAQGSRHFTIDGEMTRDSMRYEPKAIQKVYLKHIVNGEEVLLDLLLSRIAVSISRALLLNLRRLP